MMKRKTIKSRIKKFRYSVPDEVLDQLVDLFRSWGIRENDWMVVTASALQRYGYHFVDKRNVGEIDILMRRDAMPWGTKKYEWTYVPALGTSWLKEFRRFIKKTGFTPHLLALPFGPWRARDIYHSGKYLLPTGTTIRTAYPQDIITSRARILIDRVMGASFYDRIPRWRRETKFLESIAHKKHDKAVLKACEYFFRITKRISIKYVSKTERNEIKGLGIGKSKARGRVRVMRRISQLGTITQGDIMVTDDTNPIFLPVMMKVKAIVTNHGGLTSHAATLAREFKIPAVIGTKVATKVLKTGDRVEVNTKTGVVRKL